MAAITSIRSLYFILAILMAGVPAFALAQAEAESAQATPVSGSAMETLALSVDGISSTSGEDSPGVVYILPWQAPTLPRRTRGALEPNAAELLEPVDPVIFERHQNFQQSLNPALNPTLDSPNSLR